MHAIRVVVFLLCSSGIIKAQLCLLNMCDQGQFQYCRNNGTCVFDYSTCRPSCICADGYAGIMCSIKATSETEIDDNDYKNNKKCLLNACDKTASHEQYCDNNASCIFDHELCRPFCSCAEEYTGTKCEFPLYSKTIPTNKQIGNTEFENGEIDFAIETAERSTNGNYNVCSENPLPRSESERTCGFSPTDCKYGVCRKELQNFGGWMGYNFSCECDFGARGLFCEHRCCLECGDHGVCEIYQQKDGNGTGVIQMCDCALRYKGEYCDEFIPLPVSIQIHESTWYLWIVGVCVGTFAILVIMSVVSPYLMWKYRVILVMKIVHYFQAYEDDDEKEWDAFVSYKADEIDESFVVNTLYPKLEKEMGFKLCLHFRDFIPGETITNNIINAVEGSRRTILILTPRFVQSEFTRFEYQKAQEEMLKHKHRIIPIVLEDILCASADMDKNLKGIINSVTYLEWPNKTNNSKQEDKEDTFWKRLQLSMPKKKVSESAAHRSSYVESRSISCATESTCVESNIASVSDCFDDESIYDEISSIDETVVYTIRPLSEKEEMGFMYKEKDSGKENVSENSVVDQSQKDKNLILSVGGFNIGMNDVGCLREQTITDKVELEEHKLRKYFDSFV